MDWIRDYFEHGYAQRWTLGPPTPETEREVDNLWAQLQLNPGAVVLDVGCGHGREAVSLATLGARVVGVDFTSALLARATNLAERLGVAVSWVRGDMRQLPVQSQSVRGALLFDAFGFFDTDDENQTVLAELARVLAPGGRLAIKVANAEPILADFRASDREDKWDTVVEIRRSLSQDPARMTEQIEIRGPQGSATYQRRQRLYRQDEIRAAVERAGLAPVNVTATAAGDAFEPATSPALVIIAERTG